MGQSSDNQNEHIVKHQSVPFVPPTFLTTEENRPQVKDYTVKCINKLNLTVLEKNYQDSLQSSITEDRKREEERSPVLVSCGNSNETLNSVENMGTLPEVVNSSFEPVHPGALRSDSSLVDLAFIPTLNNPVVDSFGDENNTMAFIDFPHDIEHHGGKTE